MNLSQWHSGESHIAGLERYQGMLPAYYRGAVGAMIVYDVTNKNTFAAVRSWLATLRRHADPQIVVMLIGNKSDLRYERQVSVQEGEELSRKLGLSFLETSALDSTNVDESFIQLMEEVNRRMRANAPSGQAEDFGEKNIEGEPITLQASGDADAKALKRSKCC